VVKQISHPLNFCSASDAGGMNTRSFGIHKSNNSRKRTQRSQKNEPRIDTNEREQKAQPR
jgi:hypothetical protein